MRVVELARLKRGNSLGPARGGDHGKILPAMLPAPQGHRGKHDQNKAGKKQERSTAGSQEVCGVRIKVVGWLALDRDARWVEFALAAGPRGSVGRTAGRLRGL